jgi:hypothetical protein
MFDYELPIPLITKWIWHFSCNEYGKLWPHILENTSNKPVTTLVYIVEFIRIIIQTSDPHGFLPKGIYSWSNFNHVPK